VLLTPYLAPNSGYLIKLFIYQWTRINWMQEPLLAWLWYHFHLALDDILTHNLPVMSWVCWLLDQTFAHHKRLKFLEGSGWVFGTILPSSCLLKKLDRFDNNVVQKWRHGHRERRLRIFVHDCILAVPGKVQVLYGSTCFVALINFI